MSGETPSAGRRRIGLTGLYYDPWPLDWTASILGQLDQIPLFNQLNFYRQLGMAGTTIHRVGPAKHDRARHPGRASCFARRRTKK